MTVRQQGAGGPVRFFLSADIEGVAGVSSREQLRPEGGQAWQRAAEAMTAEVAAVAGALLAAGATEVVVADSHGNAQNLVHARLPRGTTLVRAWPRPLDMMEGIDRGPYDGALFIGHHAGAASRSGVLAHTYSGRWFTDVRVNGESVSETMVNAWIAGHFGVPVLLASGDHVYCAHVAGRLPGTRTVETKRAIGTLSAAMRHPDEVLEELAEAAAAVARADRPQPVRLAGPVALEIDFAARLQAELLAYLPGVERIAANGIRHVAPDIVAAVRFLHFLQAYPQSFQ